MVSTKENELSDLAAIALDVYIETNKNKQNQGKNEQKREIKKRYKTEVFDNNYSSGLKYAVYVNQNKPNEVILAFAGTDINMGKRNAIKDIFNDFQMGASYLPSQFKDAIPVYVKTKQKYPNAKITITGHSLGGSLAQLVGAATGEKTVTFNPYGTKNIFKHLDKFGVNKNKDYSNITNYKTSNDLLFNAFELGNCNKNPGKTYIVEDNSNMFDSHNNLLIIPNAKKIHSETFISDRLNEKESANHSNNFKLKGYLSYDDIRYNDYSKAAEDSSATDPFIQGFDGEKKDDRSPSQKTADEINNDKWDSNDISFLEGFHSKDKDNHLIKEAKNKRKEKAKSKGNEGKGPNGEDRYWYTTKTGKHVFVPDD